ncbi:acyl-CoA Delta(11) desaturase-like isoform X1 [Camponotus floridanus]|uniref:acyl-CoA Delta(11) desaturase-like isoform X1 n=1 Tax=Camponotus floridanus TaxID=104421 RepID=UPI000DC67A50|nr:acyl-CoA Delta(11) desaturase-like isoform X1 [Camponotus floridanus]XP_025265740.1 acyl-CoA Delta(11) desaturase-like isoform X1 [Camponotus floridanus]
MAPNTSNPEMQAEKNFCEEKEESSIITDDMQNRDETCIKSEGLFKFKTEVKWFNAIFIIFLHISMLYACFTFEWCKDFRTNIWMLILIVIGGIGITAGAHRLWTHRAYKAKWPLRIILLICYVSAGQNNLFDWVRDHRVHHKYTDTDADPHNSNRGFFFSHVGWLMLKKHPDVIRKGRQIDMRDILADPVVMFGYKYFSILSFIFAFLVPNIMVPVYGWNETWSRAFMAQIIHYVYGLNCIWSVNSVAHLWGSKPYDMSINPSENKYVAFVAFGEGWHNYHHVFPWDYKTAELGNYSLNFTTMFIDFCAKIGWAYDLKQPSEELIRNVVMRNDHSLRQSVLHKSRKIG